MIRALKLLEAQQDKNEADCALLNQLQITDLNINNLDMKTIRHELQAFILCYFVLIIWDFHIS